MYISPILTRVERKPASTPGAGDELFWVSAPVMEVPEMEHLKARTPSYPRFNCRSLNAVLGLDFGAEGSTGLTVARSSGLASVGRHPGA